MAFDKNPRKFQTNTNDNWAPVGFSKNDPQPSNFGTWNGSFKNQAQPQSQNFGGFENFGFNNVNPSTNFKTNTQNNDNFWNSPAIDNKPPQTTNNDIWNTFGGFGQPQNNSTAPKKSNIETKKNLDKNFSKNMQKEDDLLEMGQKEVNLGEIYEQTQM